MSLLGLLGVGGGLSFSSYAQLDAYLIEKSCRFNSGDSSYLSKSFDNTPSGLKHTWSFWFKPATGQTGNENMFGSWVGVGYQTDCWLDSLGKFGFYQQSETNQSCIYYGNRSYRDPSAWYHAVISIDRTQTTNTDRMKIYINGEDVTSDGHSGSPAYPDQNVESYFPGTATNDVSIGRFHSGQTLHYNGLISDFQFIDGESKTASDFGEFDLTTGIWYPKKYAGTYGTNGYYLKFNGTDVGEDSSGNGNDWTSHYLTNTGGTVNYANSISNSPYLPINAFSSPYIFTYLDSNLSTITNTAWEGAYDAGNNTNVFTPPGGLSVTSSFVLYYGAYNNSTTTTSLTITYTDTSTETDTFTSGSNNWMGKYTATSAAGKTIQSISISNPSNHQSFGAFIIDGVLLESYDLRTDVSLDTPTNYGDTDTGVGGEVGGNHSTINPLGGFGQHTLSDGNLQITTTSGSGYEVSRSTISTPLSGKWYAEMKVTSQGSSSHQVGLISSDSQFADGYDMGSINLPDGTSGAVYYYAADGTTKTCGVTGSSGNTWGLDDVIGIAYNADDHEVIFYKNGVAQASNFNVPLHPYVFGCSEYNNTSVNVYVWNFGQRKFTYPAPSGYKCLCTQNLPDPTIKDPSKHFDVAIDTGANILSAANALTDGADFVWIKDRDNNSTNHSLFNRINDTGMDGTPHLRSNEPDTEATCGTYSAPSGNSVAWVWNAGTANTVVEYDNSEDWSSSSTLSTPGGAFDGTDMGGSGNATYTSSGETLTTSAITINSKLEIYTNRTHSGSTDGTKVTINSTDYYDKVLAATGWSEVDLSGATLPLTTSGAISIEDEGGASSGIWGVRVDGKVLIDSGNSLASLPSVYAGDLNGAAYNQDQTWTTGWSQTGAGTYLSGSGLSTMEPDKMFNWPATDYSCIPGNSSGGYNAGSEVTFTPNGATGIPCSSLILKAQLGGNGGLYVNGVDRSSSIGQSWAEWTIPMPAGHTHLKTLKFTTDSGTHYIQTQYIKVNGKYIIDAGESVTSVPSIPSTYRANPTAGFSIVSYTGTGSNATVAHGLNADPAFVLIKNRGDANNWAVYHGTEGIAKYGYLDTDAAFSTSSASAYFNTAPTSTVFGIGTTGHVNTDTKDYIAYCWSEVVGYSKFGGYTGNGTDGNGPFVYCGFKPRFIMLKRTDNSAHWVMYDTARDTYNEASKSLYASNNVNNNETYLTSDEIDILSNGFKLRSNDGTINASSSATYIFAAFAEQPFKYARAR